MATAKQKNVKKKYHELFHLDGVLGKFLKKNPQESKIKYAIEVKLVPQMNELVEDYYKSVKDIERENCEVNDKGYILRDENKAYIYSKEGEAKMENEKEALWKKEVELVPHIVDVYPPLSDEERKLFTGIVI